MKNKLSVIISVAIISFGIFTAMKTVVAVNTAPSTSVNVGAAVPSISGVTLSSSTIYLTPLGTTSLTVAFTVQDYNKCSDVFTSGVVTTTLYRSSFAGGANCVADGKNCFVVVTPSANTTNDCSGNNVTAHATTTFALPFYTQATDASSSFAGDTWVATVQIGSGGGLTASSSYSSAEVQTLTAIDVTPTINYGSVPAGAASAEQTTVVQNAGNSTTTLKLSGTDMAATDAIPVGQQHYSTSTGFTYGTGDVALTNTATAISNFKINQPSNGTPVVGNVYWLLQVSQGVATGTYSGTNTFTAVYSGT